MNIILHLQKHQITSHMIPAFTKSLNKPLTLICAYINSHTNNITTSGIPVCINRFYKWLSVRQSEKSNRDFTAQSSIVGNTLQK